MVSYEYFWDRYYLKLRILKNGTYKMLEDTYKIENKQPIREMTEKTIYADEVWTVD